MAFTRRLGAGNDEIFTIKATGGDPIRLTNSSASDGSPDWQPQ